MEERNRPIGIGSLHYQKSKLGKKQFIYFQPPRHSLFLKSKEKINEKMAIFTVGYDEGVLKRKDRKVAYWVLKK